MINGKIKPGDVVVVRYEGPRGGPGMREMLSLTSMVKGIPELSSTTALITDGRFSGGTRGLCIGHVSPGGGRGRPDRAAARRRHDRDRPARARRLDVELSTTSWRCGAKRGRRPSRSIERGWLARYTRLVTNASNGAVLA